MTARAEFTPGPTESYLEELKESVEDLNQRDDNLERLLEDVPEKSMPLNATQRIKDRHQAISRQRQSLANTRSIAESSAKGPLPAEISTTLVRIEGENLRRGLGI
jgi:predicted  nucleic acid-binding Zn-ribbon protein